MNKLPMIILYVADQKRSTEFYQKILDKSPVVNVPGMTEFLLTENFLLGLMPEKNIQKLLDIQTTVEGQAKNISRCELYLKVDDPAQQLKKAIAAGATEISKEQYRSWGDAVAYCSDPDGHIIAFAKRT